MRGIASQTIAAIFALAAFAVAIVAGLAGGNAASAVIGRAMIALVACYPLGLIVGLIAQRVIDEHIRAHREAHPAPDSTQELRGDLPPSSSGDDDVITV